VTMEGLTGEQTEKELRGSQRQGIAGVGGGSKERGKTKTLDHRGDDWRADREQKETY
jgi:hypothetical protein